MPAQTLFTYLQQTQRFLRDQRSELWNPADLIDYVNQARREIAMRAQCVRVVPRISGSIGAVTINNGGSLYSAPTLSVSAPDSPAGTLVYPNGAQAVGTVTQIGGVITDIFMDFGGDGYFQPGVQINDPTGSGADLTPVILEPILTANFAQEVYNFKDVDLSDFPGVESIYAVLSVSIIYANTRFSVAIYSFPQYQALIRGYAPGNYYYVPCLGAQYGRGVDGSFYLYPPPSQQLQMEWDCVCLPQDLISDQSEEAIPQPWGDAVPYYAAHLAFLEIGNLNAARAYSEMFDDRVKRFGAYTLPGRAINPYGRP